MVRGRIGGDGAAFNLGEATVSRAAVRLASGEVGFGYALGRDRDKARLIALCDALAQSEEYSAVLETQRARAFARGHARPAIGKGRRKPRRRGSISTRWCAEKVEDDDGRRTFNGLCRQGGVGAFDLPFRDGCDGASGQRSANRGGGRYAVAAHAGHRGDCADACSITIRRSGSTQRMSETPEVANWLKFHSGAPVVTDPSICGFAVVVRSEGAAAISNAFRSAPPNIPIVRRR